MEYLQLTNDMLNLLGRLKGETFVSMESELGLGYTSFGNVRINTNSFSVEVISEEKPVKFFDGYADIASYECVKKDIGEKFIPYCGEDFRKDLIGEKITEASVITDRVSINNGEYEITLDVAIEIKTDKHSYIFAKDWQYCEVIHTKIDTAIEAIYPIKKVISNWDSFGSDTVNVKRTERTL